MPPIESLVENSAKLTAVFGRWPSFHDAEVIELSASTSTKRTTSCSDNTWLMFRRIFTALPTLPMPRMKWVTGIGPPFGMAPSIRNGRTGEYRWFVAHALPMRDETGHIVRWFGTCTDIDARKSSEGEREHLLADLTRSNAEAEESGASTFMVKPATYDEWCEMMRWITETCFTPSSSSSHTLVREASVSAA